MDSGNEGRSAVLIELLYIQLHRTIRRAMTCLGDLERDGLNPYAKNQRALRYMGSLDAEVFQLRDLLEELAAALQLDLPRRGEAHERSKGANASGSRSAEAAPESQPVPAPTA